MKIRPLGDITTDLEPLLSEMAEVHDMQIHEILAIIKGYLIAHHPGSIESYVDGTYPVYYYGHIDGLKNEE